MAVVENKMVRYSNRQLEQKLQFIENYMLANNAADGSTFDPNSNVAHKNVATLEGELHKDENIQIKRALFYKKIKEIWGINLADEYLDQLEGHILYAHDETCIKPYCVAISMYPFLTDGLRGFGGEIVEVKHLNSFCGTFINLVYSVASQFAGAVATVEFLMYFDHFARKEYGDDYITAHEREIKQELQAVVHAMNIPASARNFQSPFWNISIFDKYYFNALFGNFYFPDGDRANWETTSELQKLFTKWFNDERSIALLTFPVLTASVLTNGGSLTDKEYEDFLSQELSEGNSFFVYSSPSIDSLSSCCRLRNGIADQLNDFSYSLGAGGVMTGSIHVLSLNFNRLVQMAVPNPSADTHDNNMKHLKEALTLQLNKMHKWQYAIKEMWKDWQKRKMLPAYDAGFINLDKQYVTIGINGFVEGAEYLGYEISNNVSYLDFIKYVFGDIISKENAAFSKEHNIKINTELVPGESLGVKFANWDKKDHLVVPRDCYNSYFYVVEDESITPLDKFAIQGYAAAYLDGGAALHLNLDDIPTKETAKKLLNFAASTNCNYFCTNVKSTICNSCHHIDKRTLVKCPKCGSSDVDYATRVIGYLRRIANFSKERKAEEARRVYHK